MTIIDDIIRAWRIGLGVDAIMAEETTAEFYGGPKEEEPVREDEKRADGEDTWKPSN